MFLLIKKIVTNILDWNITPHIYIKAKEYSIISINNKLTTSCSYRHDLEIKMKGPFLGEAVRTKVELVVS